MYESRVSGGHMVVGDREIGGAAPCYVVAEVGHNHQGDVEKCKAIFTAAKEAGADAVKLQKRDNRALFRRDAFDKPYENENSFGATYGDHREALEFDKHQYLELKAFAQEIGIDFFATPFDLRSVEFLEGIGVPAYKICSADIRNTPLLREVASTGRPVIVSTGGATMVEIEAAMALLETCTTGIGLLQCTAGYPAAWDELDLRVIETFRTAFPTAVVGLSSHDNGIAMAVAAYVLGARIIEKHFTLDRTWRGTDHKFSLEPAGMRKMVRDLRRVEVALGSDQKRVHESERTPIRKMSKAVVAARPLAAGHVLTADDLAAKSPGDGLPPSEQESLLGARVLVDLAVDALITDEVVFRAGANGLKKRAGVPSVV
jgi:sialic acid synthase